nr:EOG090X01LQ [Lepidurus arcticus]
MALGLINTDQPEGGLALEQLVSEALQMVLKESKHLFDSLDTEKMKELIQSQGLATTASSFVEKAVKSLATPTATTSSFVSKPKPSSSSSKHIMSSSTPKYTPTPIAVLKKVKPGSSSKLQASEATYIPSAIKSTSSAPMLSYTPTTVSKSSAGKSSAPLESRRSSGSDPQRGKMIEKGRHSYDSSSSNSRSNCASEDSQSSTEESYIPAGQRSSFDYVPSRGNNASDASYTPNYTKDNARVEATYLPSNIQNHAPEPSYIPAGYGPSVDYQPSNSSTASEPSYVPDSPTKSSANYQPSGKSGQEPSYSPFNEKNKPLPFNSYVPTVGQKQTEETYSPASLPKKVISSSTREKSKEVSPERYLAQLETTAESAPSKEKKSSSSSSRRSSSHSSRSHVHKSSKSKDRDKEKEKHNNSKSKHTPSTSSSHKSNSSHKSRHKDKERDKERESKRKTLESHPSSEVQERAFSPSNFPDDLEDLEAMLAEMNGDVDDECYKIFQEFQAPDVVKDDPQTLQKDKRKIEVENDDTPNKKQRTAHDNAAQRTAHSAAPPPRKAKLSPGMAMLERLKQQQAIIEQQKEALEAATRKRVSSKKVPEARNNATAKAIAPPSFALQGAGKRRIAHVPNVASLLQTKAPKVNSPSKPIPSSSSTGTTAPSTPAAPRQTTLPRPIITTDFGSKVPASIRQRYLNILVDECLKFYSKEQEAYDRALAEEQNCYGRSANRNVYLNVVVNCVKKIRTEASGRNGESSSEIASSSGAKGSHLAVLAGKGGTKGSWSIEKPKKTIDILTGISLYQFFTRYLMTEEQLDVCAYPRPDPAEKGKALVNTTHMRGKNTSNKATAGAPKNQRTCDRCTKNYYVDSKGVPLREETCVFHWGKPFTFRGQTQYSCCKGEQNSEGCEVSKYHICESFDADNLRGYMATFSKPAPADGNYGVFALDCEMCYTTEGNELTRVTVVDSQCRTVYETLVKPEHPLLDCNTRFSGITEEDLRPVKTTIRDVQAALLSMFSDKTILIGHSLDSDLRALKLIHKTVIDTSIVFPHKMGLPYRRALRNLCVDFLKKLIQNDEGGHDSAEDAIACMELMMWKMKEDLKMLR